MNHLITLESGQTGGLSMLAMLGVYAVFIVALYFIFFRPQSKKKKKEAEMRKNAQVWGMRSPPSAASAAGSSL